MGGEKQRRLLSGPADGGSPPRRRGKVAESLDGSLCLRITPAWAGKRFWNRPWVWATSDHPRVGGEKPLYDPAHLGPQGSPPRRRGKGKSAHGASGRNRITPAWAGKRHLYNYLYRNGKDHPRMGGEKILSALRYPAHGGSPPHGRGKEETGTEVKLNYGITPAWAGKSLRYIGNNAARWDHPRMGGEKGQCTLDQTYTTGSPPHGRGKVGGGVRGAACLGITPAWAGKSLWLNGSWHCPRDYPRMGGEKFYRKDVRNAHLGSPPHGRGKVSLAG